MGSTRIMKLTGRLPRRATAAVAISTLVAGVIGLLAPGHAAMSTPSSSSIGATASQPAATTTVPLTLENGIFTAPDGSLSVAFSAVPTLSIDTENNVVSYLLGVDEDTQSVVIFRSDAFGATAESTVSERADLFLGASGTDIEPLANSTTHLGPFPTSHFIARLTLGDGQRAVVYGVVVVRNQDVVYAFHTDIGGDDSSPATTFVESFALVISPPPVPTTSTTTSTVPSSAPVESAETSATAPTSIDPSVSTTATTSAPAPPRTVAAEPPGATLGYDGRWWVTFPEGATPSFRASTENGYAYAQYLAIVGDDTLIARVTEVPAGFEWVATEVADAEAERVGGVVEDSDVIDVGGHEAARFTIAQDDSDTSGDTTQMLVINGGGRIYRVTYEDGGATSTSDGDAFVESFALA